jgi:hypothetical protein
MPLSLDNKLKRLPGIFNPIVDQIECGGYADYEIFLQYLDEYSFDHSAHPNDNSGATRSFPGWGLFRTLTKSSGPCY